MSIRKSLTALLLSASAIAVSAQGTWTAKTNFGGGARSMGVAFSIGHKGYIGLGSVNVAQTGATDDLWEYDPITNAWSQKAPFLGGQRKLAVAFVVNGKAYVGTGQNANSVDVNDLWQYTPSSNSWIQRAALGGVARNGAVAFSIGGFGYVGTGKSGVTLLSDFWQYNAAVNTWSPRTSFGGGPRVAAAAFAVSGAGYVGTGQGTGNGIKKDLWKFNPIQNTWEQKLALPSFERLAAVGFTVGNFGYFGTGVEFGLRQDIWQYDPGTNTWLQKANLPIAVGFSSAFSLAGRGYLGTGAISNSITANFYEFDPGSTQASANTWTQKASIGNTTRFRAVGFSIGSKGYIATGLANGTAKKDFWQFDPSTNAWTQMVDFGGVARFEAVGFSIGTKGYIGTGAISNNISSNDFWAFDQAANTWTQKASFGGSPRRSAVGFSIGTKGYIGTGFDGTNRGDFWEYNPTSDTWSSKANFGPGPRTGAAGFSIGSKGYIGTGDDGEHQRDFWEYSPTANSWTQKADFGGTTRTVADGFAAGIKGYLGMGYDGSARNDYWEYDPTDDSWTQKANFGGLASFTVSGFTIGSKVYIDNGFSSNNFWEYEPGPVNCAANQVTINLSTDRFSSETTWEILPSGSPNPVCNGNGYASNSTIAITCCLPNGCYDLRVFDSFGDGILSPGGYDLRDASNQRIVDNNGNGSTFTTLSQVTNGNSSPWSFCVPLGTDALVAGSCDQVFTLNSTVTIQVQENPAVTAQLAASPDSSGYQICIFDPNGGFRRNLYRTFDSPGTAFPVGTPNALKPTFFNLNFSQAPFLPVNKLLNVRVRGSVNGVFFNCGPACRLVVGTPPCTTTKLTTTATPQVSCGATKSVNGGQLFCDLVTGANRYRFQFAGPNNYVRNVVAPAAAVNSLAARTLTLGVFQQQPLPCGVPLTVRVQASFDGGVTFCPLGPACTVTVTGCPVQMRSTEAEETTTMRVWPNPAAGGRLNIQLEGITADNATVDLSDAFGRSVLRRTIAGTGSGLNTVLELGNDVAEGLYFVSITAGEEIFTRRVLITR